MNDLFSRCRGDSYHTLRLTTLGEGFPIPPLVAFGPPGALALFDDPPFEFGVDCQASRHWGHHGRMTAYRLGLSHGRALGP